MCRKDLTAKLRRLGLEVDEQEIIVPIMQVLLLSSEGLNAVVWFFALGAAGLPN